MQSYPEGYPMASEERRTLESVCYAAGSEGELRRDQWERLRSTFGDRFDKAWRLVTEKRIKRYIFEPSGRVIWIAVGREKEYQVLPASGYCGCSDFYYRVLESGGGVCYHLIAQRLAECLRAYDDVREEDEFHDALMKEWRDQSLEEEEDT